MHHFHFVRIFKQTENKNPVLWIQNPGSSFSNSWPSSWRQPHAERCPRWRCEAGVWSTKWAEKNEKYIKYIKRLNNGEIRRDSETRQELSSKRQIYSYSSIFTQGNPETQRKNKKTSGILMTEKPGKTAVKHETPVTDGVGMPVAPL